MNSSGSRPTSAKNDFSTLDGNVLLCAEDVAEILGVAPITLRNWRATASTVSFETPRFVKIGAGRAVRYRVADVREYLSRLSQLRAEHAA
jgi:hypothetical protein